MSDYAAQRIIGLLTICFELFIIYIYVTGLIRERKRLRFPAALLYIAAGVIMSAAEFIAVPSLPYMVAALISVFMLFRCFDHDTVLTHLFKTVGFTALMIMSEVLVMGGIILVSGTDADYVFNDTLLRLIGTVVSKLMQILLTKIMVMLMKRRPGGRVPVVQVFVLAVCQILTIYLMSTLIALYWKNAITPVQMILQAAAVLFINIVVFWYYDRIVQNAELRHQMETLELQTESRMEYYELVRSQQEQAAALKHDIQKHVNVIKGMLDKGGDSAATRYLSKLELMVGGVSVHTPNPAVSAILQDCAAWALGVGITPVFDISIYENIGIDEPDITVVMGNTIENAKRALENMGNASERRLGVILKQKAHFLYYEISNTFHPQADNSSSGAAHYGLHNVRRCVEKYGGRMDTLRDNSVFTVRIAFGSRAD